MDSAGLLAARKRAVAKAAGTRWCPHEPFPNQQAFLALTCLDALYGGAAGGGKSDALLMAALQFVHEPGYAAILFRRTYADLALPGAIMDRSQEWLAGTDATWNGEKKTWTFPSGATLSFGYLDNERDRFRYKSSEFQFIGFDEGTEFPEKWCLYLFSRLRRLKGSTVPLRFRVATNPGGIGHKWVKKRYVDPDTANAPFVPSKLDDNPHIDQAAYLEALAMLDPTTRRQLRDGAWVQDAGGLVYAHFDRKRNVGPMPNHQEIVRVGRVEKRAWRFILAMDFGFTDDCAFVVLGWRKHSRVVYVIHSEKRAGLVPSAAGARAKELEEQFKPDRVVGDIGGLGKGYSEEMRWRFSVPVQPAEKTNKLGYIKLINGALETAELILAAGVNDELVTELEDLPWLDEKHEKEAPGFPNHLADATLYGWRAARAWSEDDEPAAGPSPGSAAWSAEQAAMAREKAIRESMGRPNGPRWAR